MLLYLFYLFGLVGLFGFGLLNFGFGLLDLYLLGFGLKNFGFLGFDFFLLFAFLAIWLYPQKNYQKIRPKAINTALSGGFFWSLNLRKIS
jgi:hypothetical protein